MQGRFDNNKDQYYLRVFIPEDEIFYHADFSKDIFDEFIKVYDKILSTFKFLTDTDNDGLYDDEEEKYGTDINNSDSDGDGYSDGDEVKNGYNPNGEGKLN
jgi:hypothetical protein